MNQYSYRRSEVEKADDFYISILCSFQYDAAGMASFIDTVLNNKASIEWFTQRPDATVERKMSILDKTSTCFENGVKNTRSYRDKVAVLY